MSGSAASKAIEAYASDLRRQLARVFRVSIAHPGIDRVVDEITAHLEDAVAGQRADGRSEDEAVAGAFEDLGPASAVAIGYRRSGTPHFARPEAPADRTLRESLGETVATISREVRLAFRNLVRAPGYAAAFVLTLGLGIGVNTAIFSVVYGIWLRPLPHEGGDRLVYLRHSAPAAGLDNVYFSVPEIEDIRSGVSSLEGVVEFSSMTFTVQGLDQPRRVSAGVVTADYFEVMGLDAIAGRLIGSRDDGENAAPVAILTDGFWRSAFAEDPGIVGRRMRMNGMSVEIVGVLEPAPPYPERTDIYVNMVASPHHLGATMTQNRIHRMTEVFARLAPGAEIDDARAEVATVVEGLHATYPEAYDASQGYAVTLTPLREQLASRASETLLFLLAVTGLVMLIACANVANLTLARVMRRQGELATRVSLGASAWRVRRQLLIESLIPALLGSALACAIAYASVDVLAAYAARYSARASEISVDGVVLGAALLAGVLAAVGFSVLPRLPRLGTSRSGVAGARITSVSGRRVQRLLVVSQVAVSCVLLVGAGLLLRTLQNLQGADGGLDLEHVLSVDMPSQPNRNTDEERLDYFQTVLHAARSLPGVHNAAFSFRVPFAQLPTGPVGGFAAIGLEIEGQPVPDGAALPRGDFRPVSPDYFDTVGLRVLSGRLFSEADRGGAPMVVVISRSMAEHHFGERDAVGQRLAWRDWGLKTYGGVSDDWRTIVGVVSDASDYDVTEAPPHVVYQPLGQIPWASALLLRTEKPASVAASVVSLVRGIEPDQPIERVAALSELYEDDIGPQRLNATLVAGFALLALVISAVGVGGVLAFGISQRTRELGIRAALGAGRRRLLAMVLVEGTALTGLGLLIGAVGALAISRVVGALLYGVSATDATTFALAAVVMLGVAVAASLAPAWRASKIDPAQALRAD